MRADLGALLGLGVVGVIVGACVIRLPAIVGTYIDDGVYLCTAKSLAEGHGYRHIELPGEPYQTKYPLLYPLALAAIWRLAPRFPENMPAVQALNMAFWTVGLWLSYRLMRRAWGLPRWLAGAGVVLTLVNPGALSMIRSAMSEPLYLMLSAVALLVLGPANGAEATSTRRLHTLGRVLLGAAAAAATYLTRSIGLALSAGVLVDLLLRRRWKAAAGVAVVAALAVGGWRLWCSHAAAANAVNRAVSELRYDLDYRAMLPPNPQSAAWVAYQNTSDLALTLVQGLVDFSEEWITATLRGGFVQAFPLYVGMVAAIVLLLVGFVATWNWKRAAIHWYLAAYLALTLLWPFSPRRFVIGILPFVTTLQLAGLYVCVALPAGVVLRSLGLSSGSGNGDKAPVRAVWPTGAPGCGAALGLVTVLAMLLTVGRVLPLLSPAPEALALLEEAQRQRDALVELVKARTPSDAVVSSPFAGYLYLRTGRQFVPPLPQDDPVPIHYPEDRKFAECGRVITRGMVEANRACVERRLADYWRTTGTTHVVPLDTRDQSYWTVFNRLRQTQPGRITLLETAGPYSLYRITSR